MTLPGIKLKICGMRDPENMMAVASLQPDYMGFIFYSGSKRGVDKNFEIPKDFPAGIKRVGVFVNESNSAILDQVEKFSLDFVQLHGEESPAQCADLQEAGVGVIKVFALVSPFDFETVEPFKKVVDYFLFDSKGPDYGGTGKVFDWRLLMEYDQEVPFFLSGGLSPETVGNVGMLKGMNLHALDVNSGVEAAPGWKDVGRVRELVGIMREGS